MAWLSSFLLGRPGYETAFDVNPLSISIDEQPIAVRQRNLAGDLKKSIIRASAPIITLNADYLTLAQRNAFASLAGIKDTFLSFQLRDDFQVNVEYDTPPTLNTVVLQNSSATRLSAALVAAGFSSIITINSVSTVPAPSSGGVYNQGGFGSGGYSGPDYFAGGSYVDSTRTINLGTVLPSLNPVYVTYTYKGWLVDLQKFTHSAEAGWLDRFKYNFQLVGA